MKTKQIYRWLLAGLQVTACQTLSPGAGPTALPTPQHSATLSFSPSPSPMPTLTALPTPWTPPPLFQECSTEVMTKAPHDVAVSQDGSQVYALSEFQIYQIKNGKASLLKNKEGKCLGFGARYLEINSNGDFILAADWQFEQKYLGTRIFFVKSNFTEVKGIGDYNKKTIKETPNTQETPNPETYSNFLEELHYSKENKGFLLWNDNKWGGLNNNYSVTSIAENGLFSTSISLIEIVGKNTKIAYDDKKNTLYFFSFQNKNLPPQNINIILKPLYFDAIKENNNLIFSFYPDTIRVDSRTGDLLISESSRIVRMNPTTQELTALAGIQINTGFKDGKGTEARFSQITAIDIDATGNIYVADSGNRAIRKITPEGMVSTLYRAPEQD